MKPLNRNEQTGFIYFFSRSLKQGNQTKETIKVEEYRGKALRIIEKCEAGIGRTESDYTVICTFDGV